MTAGLVQFLRARIAEDEQATRQAIEDEFLTSGRWLARGPYGDNDRFGNIQSEQNEQIVEESLPWATAVHIARHDPARTLVELDAKRRALDHYERIQQHTKQGVLDYVLAEGAVRKQVEYMALPYAEHPDYRKEWKP